MPLRMYKPKSTKREEGAEKAREKAMGGGMMRRDTMMKKVERSLHNLKNT